MNVNGSTRFIGLLGYPLGHSLSPLMQNLALEHRGLNKIYIPLETRPEDLSIVVKALPKMNFDGFNVTIPYKIEVMKYLDAIDQNARLIGAVNTVDIKEGRFKGYNTDGTGFLRSLEENIKDRVEGKNIFILGAGGASRAIAMTLAMKGARKVYICNRTYERSVDLSDSINKSFVNRSEAVPMEYDHMKRALDDSEILINTTKVGMYPDVDHSPIDKKLLHKGLIVYDIVYNPEKTKLLEEAEELGCKTISGLWMLVYQGAEAFEIWTGKKAPVDKMYEAIYRRLKEK